MSPSAIFVGLLLFGLTAYAATIPWRQRASQEAAQAAAAPLPVPDLEAQAESSYAALADLAFDRSVGKLNDEDYQHVRGQLMAQTVAVLQELDSAAADVESQVEAQVSVRRAQRVRPALTGNENTAAACPSCGTPARSGDKYCGRCEAELGHTCPGCGASVKSGDRFCVRCGTALAVGAATSRTRATGRPR